MQTNQLSTPGESSSDVMKHVKGVVLGGGWEHDDFGNPCARVEILVNAHHITLVDDTANGWTLGEFDDAPNPEEAFKKFFGVEFGEDAEFDYAVLRDFVSTLERVGSERIAEAVGGKAISLFIEWEASA